MPSPGRADALEVALCSKRGDDTGEPVVQSCQVSGKMSRAGLAPSDTQQGTSGCVSVQRAHSQQDPGTAVH